jgi:hypothetical protein
LSRISSFFPIYGRVEPRAYQTRYSFNDPRSTATP